MSRSPARTRVAKRSLAALSASLLVAGGLGIAAATPASAAGVRHDDFNGDGYRDLVVAAPSATVGGHARAGYVAVLWGSKSGISASRRTVISQATAGVPGAPEYGDSFGQAVASGDLDGDGYADLAVGIPGEDVGTVQDAGGVTVLWGSVKGLTGDSTWVGEDEDRTGDEFGTSLATGHFIGDGGTGLAVLAGTGVWEIDGQPSAALSPQRLATPNAPANRTGTLAATLSPTAIVAGDFNGDAYTDLVELGVDTSTPTGSGWSEYFEGGVDGLQPQGDFPGGPVGASGDLNRDGTADLVTAEPLSPGEEEVGGTVKVWYGGVSGPLTGAPQVWTQNSTGVPGTGESGDEWGADLSVGDANGDGYADLAIGAPAEDIGTVRNAGAVTLLRGSAKGVTATSAQSYNQNSASVPGTAEQQDRFGGQVRLIDANGDGKAGLVTSAPGENDFSGYCWVFSGTSSGLTASGSWTFNGASLGAPSTDAAFGQVLGQ